MLFSHISIGGGIVGTETILSIVDKFIQSLQKSKTLKNKLKLKKFNFAIIDKDISNIPGGVAYSFKNSKYGYFNNPIRLCPKHFRDWLEKKENKNKIIKYLKTHGGHTGQKWLQENKKNLFTKSNKAFKELYIPRAVMTIWMQERLINMYRDIKIIKKKYNVDLNIYFFQGQVIKLSLAKKKIKKIFFYKKFCTRYKINFKKEINKVTFTKLKKNKKILYSKTLSISLGLNPPKQYAKGNAKNLEGYIWDFYAAGATSEIIKRIIKKMKKNNKKEIIIYFIGYKAGLLEAMTELKYLIIEKGYNIKLISSSKNLKTIEKAELIKGKSNYKLYFFRKNKIKNLNTSGKLYKALVNEFNFAKTNGYGKYDAWTQILTKKIISKCFKYFSSREINKYNSFTHTKIRNLTRFTYPETIKSKDLLINKKILILKKEKVANVCKYKNKILINAISKTKKIKRLCDFVINVSGPLSINNVNNEIPIINNLKFIGGIAKTNGFLVDKNFQMTNVENLFLCGTLAQGFNPERKTIIEAVLSNSKISANKIYKLLINNK